MEHALALGLDRIECDVRRAAGGALVLVHDDELALLDGRRRPVDTLTTAAIRSLLPDLLTLDELAVLVAGRIPLLLDVKRPGYASELINAIDRYQLAVDSIVSPTHASTLVRARRAFPKMRTGLSTGHCAAGAPTSSLRALACGARKLAIPAPLIAGSWLIRAIDAMLQHQVATAPLVAALHAGGWRVDVWTVDQSDSIRRALDLVVDRIISDRPDLVRDLI